MFAGHFANIKRMAAQGLLKLAGPADGVEGWRGILHLCGARCGASAAAPQTDPVIAQGEMVAEYHRVYLSAALMELPAMHDKVAATTFLNAAPLCRPQANTAATQAQLAKSPACGTSAAPDRYPQHRQSHGAGLARSGCPYACGCGGHGPVGDVSRLAHTDGPAARPCVLDTFLAAKTRQMAAQHLLGGISAAAQGTKTDSRIGD